MSRGSTGTIARAATVWGLVTGATAGGLAAAVPLVAPAAWTATGTFAELLVRLCALVLAVALLRLWVVTSETVVRLLAGRTPRADGATRRLVLLACGAALGAGVVSPASASDRDRLLDGLRLPDRAVAAPVTSGPTVEGPVPASTAPSGTGVHVVRPGESLWSIAAATSPPGTDLAARWRSIWAANREVVGDDPDLILPGQRLSIPPAPTPGAASSDRRTPSTTAKTDETGDRP